MTKAKTIKDVVGYENFPNTPVALFAKTAHAGQTYKGEDYFDCHVTKVVNRLLADNGSNVTYGEIAGALLHDVVEDTKYTLADIYAVFGPQVAALVDLLTHREGDTYFEYINRLKCDPSAVKVKLADLSSNIETAVPGTSKYARYEKAIKILTTKEEAA